MCISTFVVLPGPLVLDIPEDSEDEGTEDEGTEDESFFTSLETRGNFGSGASAKVDKMCNEACFAVKRCNGMQKQNLQMCQNEIKILKELGLEEHANV